MPNPGTFRGKRGAYLLSQAGFYKQAVKENKVADANKKIIQGYFRRFPPEHPFDWEPTDAFLEGVDDDALEDEVKPPERADYESALASGEGEEDIRVRKERDEARFQTAVSEYEARCERIRDQIPVRETIYHTLTVLTYSWIENRAPHGIHTQNGEQVKGTRQNYEGPSEGHTGEGQETSENFCPGTLVHRLEGDCLEGVPARDGEGVRPPRGVYRVSEGSGEEAQSGEDVEREEGAL